MILRKFFLILNSLTVSIFKVKNLNYILKFVSYKTHLKIMIFIFYLIFVFDYCLFDLFIHFFNFQNPLWGGVEPFFRFI